MCVSVHNSREFLRNKGETDDDRMRKHGDWKIYELARTKTREHIYIQFHSNIDLNSKRIQLYLLANNKWKKFQGVFFLLLCVLFADSFLSIYHTRFSLLSFYNPLIYAFWAVKWKWRPWISLHELWPRSLNAPANNDLFGVLCVYCGILYLFHSNDVTMSIFSVYVLRIHFYSIIFRRISIHIENCLCHLFISIAFIF